ncbi:hypothetical protein H072_10751 [Dactylellina haptotyla CBS 200.50]|uniref:Uncharacterized protein n=1 Tax=Dactylellina haptotyla (strain CBS 200.50) TaxID=1284197 RepID=S8BKK9_DACHA|nr:hypothetical protein H072_10751 [Dactylellina haptotyla CBS 200.50]
MIRQSWSIRIETPKPPRPSPPSAASKIAHWAGIPHYRLPRFNLTDEAMLHELQTEELDDEDYSLLPSRSSTIKQSRKEVELVNVPDSKSFTDRAPKSGGRKLRKLKLKKGKKAAVVAQKSQEPSEIKATNPVEPELRAIPGDVQGNYNSTVPAHFDSNSTDYPRHPRTPDRYMLSRTSSGRERRSSLSSTSDRMGDHSFNDNVKSPIALRKSPPQFLQNWDDSNPYTYMNRAWEPENAYPPRTRASNHSMSMASSSRLPILHESRHEISGDEGYQVPRAQTMMAGFQLNVSDTQSRQRSRRESSIRNLEPVQNFHMNQGHAQHTSSQGLQIVQAATSFPNSGPPTSTAAPSLDEPASTEMSTEILIAGERMEKRSHLQPPRSIEEWARKVGSPDRGTGTPKTLPSNEVEVEEQGDEGRKPENTGHVWQALPLHERIENPEIPIPVPTKTLPEPPMSRSPLSTKPVELITPSHDSAEDSVPRADKKLASRWPTVAQIRTAEALIKPDVTETSTPLNLVIIPPLAPTHPPPIPPTSLPPTLPPIPPTFPIDLDEKLPSPPPDLVIAPTISPVTAFTIDPKAAEKRRMTIAFGITPLQRRETAEMAHDVMRRVSSISTGGRRGSLASMIRVVDLLLVREREEQLRQARRAEMLWD